MSLTLFFKMRVPRYRNAATCDNVLARCASEGLPFFPPWRGLALPSLARRLTTERQAKEAS
jgi:hypothetical protein